ncbi:hypothetical protein D3C74_229250 [compost metagenome]
MKTYSADSIHKQKENNPELLHDELLICDDVIEISSKCNSWHYGGNELSHDQVEKIIKFIKMTLSSKSE